MEINKKIILNVTICTIILIATMVLFLYLKYIDISVIKAIYLPLYLMICLSILFKQYIFGYIFMSSIVLGLVIEYIIHLKQNNMNMAGTFANTSILFIGAIIGVVLQIVFKRIGKEDGVP